MSLPKVEVDWASLDFDGCDDRLSNLDVGIDMGKGVDEGAVVMGHHRMRAAVDVKVADGQIVKAGTMVILNTPWHEPGHHWVPEAYPATLSATGQAPRRRADKAHSGVTRSKISKQAQFEQLMAAYQAGAISIDEAARLMGVPLDPPLSAEEAERMNRIEAAVAVTEIARRRGSWFQLPDMLDPRSLRESIVEPDAWRGRTKPAGMTMITADSRAVERRGGGQLPRVLMDMRMRAIGRIEFPSELTSEIVKRPEFLPALDVVCMHCRWSVWFQDVIAKAQCTNEGALIEETLRCVRTACRHALWPVGGFREANLARQLTGDFMGFNEMLMHPPESAPLKTYAFERLYRR